MNEKQLFFLGQLVYTKKEKAQKNNFLIFLYLSPFETYSPNYIDITLTLEERERYF